MSTPIFSHEENTETIQKNPGNTPLFISGLMIYEKSCKKNGVHFLMIKWKTENEKIRTLVDNLFLRIRSWRVIGKNLKNIFT